MAFRFLCIGSFALAASLASASFAASWSLLDASFKTHELDVGAIDIDAVSRAGPGATQPATQPARFEMASVVELSKLNPKLKPAGVFLHLADGQRIAGAVQAIHGETLTWRGELGTWTLDLKQVRAIGPVGALIASESQAEDVVRLNNGDTLTGVVAGADAKRLTLQSGTDATPIDWANVASLRIVGDAPKPLALDAPLFRVSTLDGSVLLGRSITGDGKTWTLTDLTGNDQRAIVADKVARVERLGGRVVWLSTLTPSDVIDRPFFPSSRVRVAVIDRRATGTRSTVAGTPVDRSLAVRSYSRLTYTITPGTYRLLSFRYAMPDDARAGNVTVRVFVDDQAMHENPNVVAGKLSDVITIDLPPTATSVALEVDYGEGYDVQDQLEWIDAALVK
jgi:hypothetical protein